MEILTRFKSLHNIDNIYNIDKQELLEKLDFCDQISKKIKQSLENNKDEFQQLHFDATLPCSMTMSALTNSVYSSCDLWSSFNKMAAYNFRQDYTLSTIENSHLRVKSLWKTFNKLKETDFNKKFKQYNLQNNENKFKDPE